MSDLDDKLREIHKDDYNCIGHAEGQLCCLELPEVIAEIKQAFTDEGWHEPVVIHTPGVEPVASEYMTGQEWYARWRDLFKNIPSDYTGDWSTDMDALISKVDEAAKRTAGML